MEASSHMHKIIILSANAVYMYTINTMYQYSTLLVQVHLQAHVHSTYIYMYILHLMYKYIHACMFGQLMRYACLSECPASELVS